jgi:cysteinyl-tRNA synthetase
LFNKLAQLYIVTCQTKRFLGANLLKFFKCSNSYRDPMAFTQSRIANGVRERDKITEFFDSFLDNIGHFLGTANVTEGDTQVDDLPDGRVIRLAVLEHELHRQSKVKDETDWIR